jgi:hypothetical protein
MAGELEPKVFGQKTCTDPIIVGQPSYNYDWVLKPSNNDVGQPQDIVLQPECVPYSYYNMRVGSIYAQGPNPSIFATGDIVSNNGSHVLSGKKKLTLRYASSKQTWMETPPRLYRGPENCSLLQRKSSRRWYYSSSIFLGKACKSRGYDNQHYSNWILARIICPRNSLGKQVVV